MNQASLQKLEHAYGLHMQGQLQEAEKLYRGILSADSENVHALNLLGMLLVNSQRPEESVTLIKRALKQEPNDPQARSNLGLAYKDLKQLELAREAFARSVELDPCHPVVHNNLGNVLNALDRPVDAISAYRQALKLKPDYPECLTNLAAALNETGQYEGALAALNHALQLRPQFAEAHNNKGEVLFKQARFADAEAAYRKAIDCSPAYTAAKINLSAALKETGQIDAARELLESACQAEPENARAYNNLGVLLEQVGNADGAALQFRRAIHLSPNYGNAYYQLAQLRGHGLTDAEVAAVHALLEDGSLLDAQRTPLSFALACAYESRADYDQSFQFLQLAQALKAQRSPYDDAKLAHYYEQIAASCHELQPIRQVPGSAVPIFVLGMPRSGTSLTEQILGSHPQIFGAGELSLMEDTLREARRLTNKPYPQCVPDLRPEHMTHLARFYLDQLQTRASGEAFIVDKTPMNFQYIGFIANLIPQARIVHCRRNPIDNCLSIFKLPFEDAHSYSHSLESLGQYYKHYQKLCKHWQIVAGNRMTEFVYEDLVADLEPQARRLFDFIDLPFDPVVLDFHQAKRIVKTPSASQVRQPIYSDSVARWKKYEQHLGPLISSLGENSRA